MRCALGVVLCLALFAGASGAAGKPNIVVLLADDLTAADLGCYGGQAHTPHIDRLASEGMRFLRCYQAAPMCAPSRHALYTGLYPVQSGGYPNHSLVRQGTRSVVQHLAPHGYRIALSGKVHVGPSEVYAFEYSGTGAGPDLDPDPRSIAALLRECRASKRPFCLFVCFNEPHWPWTRGDARRYPPEDVRVPPQLADTPGTRVALGAYLAEVTLFDTLVGRVLDLLAENDLAEDTLVIVLTDQGASFPFAKWTCYEAGLQSACVVRWPERIAPGVVSDALIESVDFVPTWVELAGGTPAPELPGKSLVPLLLGKTGTHKKHVYGIQTSRGIGFGPDHYGIRSVRDERFKYIRNLTPEVEFTSGCTASDFFLEWQAQARDGDADAAEKIRRYQHRPAEELYDLAADPHEQNNLAGDPALAEVQGGLRAELDAWMAAQGDRGQATELEAFRHMRRKSVEEKR